MRRSFLFMKTLAVGLTLVLFATNVLLAHSSEFNFWSERQKLAGLPANFPQLPIPASSISKQIRRQIPKEQSARASSLIQSLPSTYGSVRHLVAPSKTKGAKTVVYLQDVHLNPEAQDNLAKALQSLIDQKAIDLVALEGAFEPLNLSYFRRFPYQKSVKAVADYFMQDKRIAGPLYTALTSQVEIPAFVGVDHPAHYKANVDAYRESAPLVKDRKARLASRVRSLQRLKRETFNEDLLDFDAHVDSYRHEQISLGSYVQFLFNHAPAPTHDVEMFLAALEAESSLDFQRVESERSQIVARLVSTLSQKETSDLLNHSVAYRMGNLSNVDFYQYLKATCKRHNISLRSYQSMDAYVRYVLLADAINVENVLKDVAEMERTVYGSLAKTNAEKQLVAESKYADLLGKLLDFSLTPDEWNGYQTLKETQANPIPGLVSFEAFYQQAAQRDEAIAVNLMDAMDKSAASVAVLVTGGFHTPGITDLLKKKGVTSVVFAPKITKVEDESGPGYLSVFTQEKTPLDKLFRGEKLFTAPLVLSPPAYELLERVVAGHAVAENNVPVDAVLPGSSMPSDTEIDVKETDGTKEIIVQTGAVTTTFSEKAGEINTQPDVRQGFDRRKFISGAIALILGGSANAQPKKEEGSKVSTVRNEQGSWLNVNGKLWSGAPGFSYQPVPANMNINQFENGNLAQLYKALLPVGGRGIDPKKYPDLVKLALAKGGVPAQGHAEMLKKQAGAKFIRTYNLAATTKADMELVSQIFKWMHETHGIKFTAGMYDPTDAEIKTMAGVFKSNPGLLIYDGWNEIDIRGAKPETYAKIDRLAGMLKAEDPHHPVALVVTQSINAETRKIIKEMKNIDIVSLTVYDRTGADTSRFVRGLSDYFDTKTVIIGETGIDTKVAPAERAKRFKEIAEALTMTAKDKPAVAPLVTYFEFTPEKWKGDDNKWWFIDENNRPTPSLPAVNEVNQKWVEGPKASDVPAPKKDDPDAKPKELTPIGKPVPLTSRYDGKDFLGTWGSVSADQLKGILESDYLRFTVSGRALDGFHVDLKGGKGDTATVGFFSLYVTRADGKMKAGAKSKAIVQEEKDGNKSTITVDIPVSEIKQAMKDSGDDKITQIHVQSGKQQNNIPLNKANVSTNSSWQSMKEDKAEKKEEKKNNNDEPLSIFKAPLRALRSLILVIGLSLGLASGTNVHAQPPAKDPVPTAPAPRAVDEKFLKIENAITLDDKGEVKHASFGGWIEYLNSRILKETESKELLSKKYFEITFRPKSGKASDLSAFSVHLYYQAKDGRFFTFDNVVVRRVKDGWGLFRQQSDQRAFDKGIKVFDSADGVSITISFESAEIKPTAYMKRVDVNTGESTGGNTLNKKSVPVTTTMRATDEAPGTAQKAKPVETAPAPRPVQPKPAPAKDPVTVAKVDAKAPQPVDMKEKKPIVRSPINEPMSVVRLYDIYKGDSWYGRYSWMSQDFYAEMHKRGYARAVYWPKDFGAFNGFHVQIEDSDEFTVFNLFVIKDKAAGDWKVYRQDKLAPHKLVEQPDLGIVVDPNPEERYVAVTFPASLLPKEKKPGPGHIQAGEQQRQISMNEANIEGDAAYFAVSDPNQAVPKNSDVFKSVAIDSEPKLPQPVVEEAMARWKKIAIGILTLGLIPLVVWGIKHLRRWKGTPLLLAIGAIGLGLGMAGGSDMGTNVLASMPVLLLGAVAASPGGSRVPDKKESLRLAATHLAGALNSASPVQQILGSLPNTEKLGVRDALHASDSNANPYRELGQLLREKGVDVQTASPRRIAAALWIIEAELNGKKTQTGETIGSVAYPINSEATIEEGLSIWTGEVEELFKASGATTRVVLVGSSEKADALVAALEPGYAARIDIVPAENATVNGQEDMDVVLPALAENGKSGTTVIFKGGYRLSPEVIAMLEREGHRFGLIPWDNYINGLLGTITDLRTSERLLQEMKNLIYA